MSLDSIEDESGQFENVTARVPPRVKWYLRVRAHQMSEPGRRVSVSELVREAVEWWVVADQLRLDEDRAGDRDQEGDQ